VILLTAATWRHLGVVLAYLARRFGCSSPRLGHAVIVWEAPDVSVVFKELMTSEQPFDNGSATMC
jgi:hypothetical protein